MATKTQKRRSSAKRTPPPKERSPLFYDRIAIALGVVGLLVLLSLTMPQKGLWGRF